jgi:hypothetical protein
MRVGKVACRFAWLATFKRACTKAGYPGRIPHDLRRVGRAPRQP